MSRTTSDAVIAVLGSHYDTVTTPSLVGLIESASAIVDRVVICATSKGVTISAAALELMERWLTAHLYGQGDPFYRSKSTGKASASFFDIDYSKVALMYDTSGCLAGILKGQTVEMFWAGKPPSEQLDYIDRD